MCIETNKTRWCQEREEKKKKHTHTQKKKKKREEWQGESSKLTTFVNGQTTRVADLLVYLCKVRKRTGKKKTENGRE